MNASDTKPKAIDLFAGAGGLSTGLRRGGFDIVGAVEFDPTAASSYRLNHKKTPVLLKDIRSVSAPELLKLAGLKRGQVDLLTGCPPCQGFSTLRRRRVIDQNADPRNELIFELLRLIQELKPHCVVVENVPGLGKDVRFDKFRRGLTATGYQHEFKILNAADYGVAQRRKRLVLIATKIGGIPPNWSRTRAKPRTVADMIRRLPPAGASGDPLHDLPERRTPQTMARIRATPKDGGSRADTDGSFTTACHLSGHGYGDVYGRMAWDAVAPTITSGCHNPSKGRFIHPTEDRAITLREAALLQSFPAKYKFDLSRGKEHAALQIGNAFPPRLIQSIAKRLALHLKDAK